MNKYTHFLANVSRIKLKSSWFDTFQATKTIRFGFRNAALKKNNYTVYLKL